MEIIVGEEILKATQKQKAKAFDLLLEYCTQMKCGPDPIGTFHDTECRMTTMLKAVMEDHWMIEDEGNLLMYYDIWVEK